MNIEPFSLPLVEPLKTGSATIESRDGFLVRVDVDGTPGIGEATPLPGWTEPLADCGATLRSVGEAVPAIEDGTLADTPAARHGVSLAILDARAREVGEPLYRYLGGESIIESVPVNATIGDKSIAETATSAESAVREGFSAVKVKVGARTLDADLDRLTAIRQRCPNVELRADANGAWNRETAGRAIERLAALDVAFVEQPLPPDDLTGHAELRGNGVGIALDEGLRSWDIDAILDADAADVLVCKPMVLGGIDRTHTVAARCQDAGLDAVITTTIDGAVARAGAVHLAAAISKLPACGLATGKLLAADIRENVAPIESGSALVPQGKGNIPPS